MKIICVGRNYARHARELGNQVPEEPVIFMKPDTALLMNGKPFYLPGFSDDIQYEAEVIFRINRNGKHIQEKYAHKYYDELSLGIDFTARDIQSVLKEKRVSWELAKAFDHSAVAGTMLKKEELGNLMDLSFSMKKNGEVVQQGNTADMLFSTDQIISYISRFITLRTGDLIYTGTPEGVGPLKIGDHFQGYVQDREVFDFKVR